MTTLKGFYDKYYSDQIAGTGPDPSDEATFQRRVNIALSFLNGRKRILDFGCGIGQATRIFADAGHEVVGVDISTPAILHARENVPHGTFETISQEGTLPFPDQNFDACYCSEVIEHLFDVAGFLQEVHRVLKPDGILVLTTPYHGLIKNLLIATFGFDRHFDPTGEHIRFFSVASIRRCLAAQRFAVIHWRGIGRCRPIWKSLFVVARLDRAVSFPCWISTVLGISLQKCRCVLHPRHRSVACCLTSAITRPNPPRLNEEHLCNYLRPICGYIATCDIFLSH